MLTLRLYDGAHYSPVFGIGIELQNRTGVDSELLQGNGINFAPEEYMSRGMLLNVLYRLDGANVASDGDKWYSDALAWSKEEGLSGGAAPEDAVSREQLAVILYRYVSAPKTEDMALNQLPRFCQVATGTE